MCERPPRLRGLRWLRSILFIAQPPLLYQEGNTLRSKRWLFWTQLLLCSSNSLTCEACAAKIRQSITEGVDDYIRLEAESCELELRDSTEVAFGARKVDLSVTGQTLIQLPTRSCITWDWKENEDDA